MEFHISRRTREKYEFDDTLFRYDGNAIFANFHAVRKFVHKLNSKRDLVTFPEQAAKASQVNAMGLIDEIFHHIFKLYKEQKNPQVLKQALAYLEQQSTPTALNAFLELFVREFPPSPVYQKQVDAHEYLLGNTDGVSNRELLIEELIMLWLSLENPALDSYRELFAEKTFINDSRYALFISEINHFFALQPYFGPSNFPLTNMLRSPAIAVPDSITGQLEYIREHWAMLLGDYLYRLLSSLDLIKEENKLGITGPGVTAIPVYDRDGFFQAGGSSEIEAFSKDREWMPRLVLMAKNSYVWLDQLSKKYQREINRLDQIPLDELETLSRWGITGLWLIGLWERSPASARIKKLCGNPEAISSAYSLHSYQIAADLGGENAYLALKENAARFGIRLASDMVPNHMGIDSDWVIHHPDRFLSLDYSPYPSYSFNGENLSSHPDVRIQIEDHYYDRTDAAVVFKRQDLRNGQVDYVYHGNDGTSMPWNDTAQLNYLNPEVREAVIQTILEVAHRFPIIRFDAAMTLAKKHYQRLWFPVPGSGGAIPSRSEHSLTAEEFNRLFPVEFWREVVDRVAVEAPDTLLLAEAFWLMEGYFVRTLGMHRVYNSAFMNMLRNEDNAGYRRLMRNTLEFDPEILKRYVNFMNNPDERTAVEQFGKSDKYFGICMLMATMPGLPMLGHGQIEGFSEKYGMEYRKAYWDEPVDNDLVSRHEREIFPLLHQRRLFAGVDHFNLYDFFTNNGNVNENVYAYTNYDAGNAALIVFNNRYEDTEGWVHTSVPQLRCYGQEKKLEQVSIAQALHLPADRNGWLVFRDQISQLQYLRPLDEVLDRGFFFRLHAYHYQTLLDFQVVHADSAHDYASLYGLIGRQGVPDIAQALNELTLKPVLEPFQVIVNQGYLGYLLQKYSTSPTLDSTEAREIQERIGKFLQGVALYTGNSGELRSLQQETSSLFLTALMFSQELKKRVTRLSPSTSTFLDALENHLEQSPALRVTLLMLSLTSRLGKVASQEDFSEQSLAWLDEFRLNKTFIEVLQSMGVTSQEIQNSALLLRIGITHQGWYNATKNEPMEEIIVRWFTDPQVQTLLRVNRYQDVLWYNRESFETLVWWLSLIALYQYIANPGADASTLTEVVLNLNQLLGKLKKLEAKSGYQFDRLFDFNQHSPGQSSVNS